MVVAGALNFLNATQSLKFRLAMILHTNYNYELMSHADFSSGCLPNKLKEEYAR